MAHLSHMHFVQASVSLLSAGFHLYESQHDPSGVPAARFQQPSVYSAYIDNRRIILAVGNEL